MNEKIEILINNALTTANLINHLMNRVIELEKEVKELKKDKALEELKYLEGHK